MDPTIIVLCIIVIFIIIILLYAALTNDKKCEELQDYEKKTSIARVNEVDKTIGKLKDFRARIVKLSKNNRLLDSPNMTMRCDTIKDKIGNIFNMVAKDNKNKDKSKSKSKDDKPSIKLNADELIDDREYERDIGDEISFNQISHGSSQAVENQSKLVESANELRVILTLYSASSPEHGINLIEIEQAITNAENTVSYENIQENTKDMNLAPYESNIVDSVEKFTELADETAGYINPEEDYKLLASAKDIRKKIPIAHSTRKYTLQAASEEVVN
jgi:hypothetical protein